MKEGETMSKIEITDSNQFYSLCVLCVLCGSIQLYKTLKHHLREYLLSVTGKMRTSAGASPGSFPGFRTSLAFTP